MAKVAPPAHLGELLVKFGLLDEKTLKLALDFQRRQSGLLGTHLLDLGFVSEDDLSKALAVQFGLPAFLSSFSDVDPAAFALIPKEVAQQHSIVPFRTNPDKTEVFVATADPRDMAGIEKIKELTGAQKVHVFVAALKTVDTLIARYYDNAMPPPSRAIIDVAPPKPGDDKPAAKSVRVYRTRGDILLCDPDPRRRVALMGMMEAGKFRVTCPQSVQEAKELLAKKNWKSVWVHERWRELLTERGKEVRLYNDPLAAMDEALGVSRALANTALQIAQYCGEKMLGPKYEDAQKAFTLAHTVAMRNGLVGLHAELLSLRVLKSALSGWEHENIPQNVRNISDELYVAITSFERLKAQGKSPQEALDELRGDPNVAPFAIKTLIQWAIKENILSGFKTRQHILMLLPSPHADKIFGHLAVAGWEIDSKKPTTWPTDPLWGVILTDMTNGLRIMDELLAVPEWKRPLVFVLANKVSDPEAVHALRLGMEDVLSFDSHPELLDTKLRRALGRRANSAGTVTGDVRDMTLTDTVQVLSNNMKTAVIRVEGVGGMGLVALEKGQIVDARTGQKEGEEAFYDILSWKEGVFRITPDEARQPKTIAGHTQGLLMEGLRRLDENLL